MLVLTTFRAQDGGGGVCLGHLVLKPCRASGRGLNFVATDRSEPYVLNKHIIVIAAAVAAAASEARSP